MSKIPGETVDAWIRADAILNPRMLIPALMRYSPNKGEVNHAIRYLEYIIHGKQQNQDPAVHNYLVSLYVKEDDDKNLINFLSVCR